MRVLGVGLGFWNGEQFGIGIRPGMDAISLALVADAWSRTYKSRALAFADSSGAIETREGIRIIPDQTSTTWPADKHISKFLEWKPSVALDEALKGIATRYGEATTDVVAMQLEYPRGSRRE